MDGRFVDGGRIVVSHPKGIILNSFGVLDKGKVYVTKEEGLFLSRRGLLSVHPTTDFFNENDFDTVSANCVDDLKSCNFLIKKHANGLGMYYPGLRTKALLEREPDFSIQSCHLAEEFDSSLLGDDLIVSVGDSEGTDMFLSMRPLACNKP